MQNRIQAFFEPELRVVWRNGRYRADRVSDFDILKGLQSLGGEYSFAPEQYDAVLAEVGEFGLSLCTIGGPEDEDEDDENNDKPWGPGEGPDNGQEND